VVTGETDLDTLLRSLQPVLNPGTYIFATYAGDPPPDTIAKAVVTVREAEGTTVVVPAVRDESQSSLMAWITLRVHSSLEAVGLTAAVASRLAHEGIACNVVAGYYHDHLFVPVDRAGNAMAALARQKP
jgi:uncharacterized protein